MNWSAVMRAIAPKGKPAILDAVAAAMPDMVQRYRLNTPRRQAHFLAQLAHESAGFRTTTEYASGKAYEGRRDLGNTQPGDGVRFRGRGLIQVTGRHNYQAASDALGVDFVNNPKLAAEFPHAIETAGWYWEKNNLNALADRDDVERITRRINGGLNGFADRKQYLAKARVALDRFDGPETKPATPVAPEPVKPPTEAPKPVEAPSAPDEPPPWWHKSPVLRQAINTLSALGISAAAVMDLPPWLIALLAVLVAGVSAYAIYVHTRKSA